MSPAVPSPVRSHVIVMAKAPVPGRVKTRLCPPCTPREAAEVAEAALADTLEAVAACGADRKIVALDGQPGPWLPPGFEVIAQRGLGFDERLAHAWFDVWSSGGEWGIQIGMDTPQITPALLDAQLGLLATRPHRIGSRLAVLGPATDGGWWLIGLHSCDPYTVFSGIAMSRSDTGRAQHRRLRELGYVVRAAPALRDIDSYDDLCGVAASITGSRTGRVASRIGDPSVRALRALRALRAEVA